MMNDDDSRPAMSLTSAAGPLLLAVGSRNVTRVALEYLRLAFLPSACCLDVLALSHFLANIILFWEVAFVVVLTSMCNR